MGLQDEDEDEERAEDVDENLMRACARVWCSKTVGGSSKIPSEARARAPTRLGYSENSKKCRRVVQNQAWWLGK